MKLPGNLPRPRPRFFPTFSGRKKSIVWQPATCNTCDDGDGKIWQRTDFALLARPGCNCGTCVSEAAKNWGMEPESDSICDPAVAESGTELVDYELFTTFLQAGTPVSINDPAAVEPCQADFRVSKFERGCLKVYEHYIQHLQVSRFHIRAFVCATHLFGSLVGQRLCLFGDEWF